ncbi:MAG TPA: hypothetical protein PLR18_01820 [bacterium]|nr:hypothetical protein [bacterium]
MNKAVTRGFSFGLVSGIITTLGLVIGLHSGTHSRSVVLSGILVIAVADAMSDAFGVHMAEETQGLGKKEVWIATLSTFGAKFLFGLTFVVPIIVFALSTAIYISVAWGFGLIILFSVWIAVKKKENVWQVVAEHLLIAVAVIAATNFVGDLIAKF